MDNRRRKRLVVWMIILFGVIVVAVGLGIGLKHFLRESEIWEYETAVGAEPATIRVTWTSDRYFGLGRHGPGVGGGNWEYLTEVAFRDGRHLRFKTSLEPRALWKLQGNYYVACYHASEWVLARVDGDGGVVAIHPGDLPPGPRKWNLLRPSTESESEFEGYFQMWLEDLVRHRARTRKASMPGEAEQEP